MPLLDDSIDNADDDDDNNARENQVNFFDGQDKLEEADGDTLRILLSTDNHLGFEENDDVRGLDSFAAFEEVLYLAKRFRCDMVLLAGDLFHENRPSRRTLYKTMEILRRYTMGQEPVQIQILGNPDAINYLNPHVSVDLPIFGIHGNHDDPTRDGGDLLAAMDLLHVNYLVNYFGRQPEVSQVQIAPILLQKGASRIALYGLGALREERLHRMWREGKVSFLRPEPEERAEGNEEKEDDDEEDAEDGFFNIFALHQNRDLGRGSKNCVQESMIPEWMDLVVWGHEHECQIDFTESVLGTFRISQPGSSVATSLVAGEAVTKKVGIMDVRGRNFRLHTVPLTQVRPFVTNEVVLSQHKARLDPEDNHIDSKITRALEEEVRLLILNAKEKQEQVLQQAEEAGSNVAKLILQQSASGSSAMPRMQYTIVHPEKVLVRIRVEHSGFSTLNNQRFGAKFVDEIANSDSILLFHRKKAIREAGSANTSSRSKANRAQIKHMEPEELEGTHMEDLVRDFLELPNQKLSLLEEKTLSEAMEAFVDKNTTQAIPDSTNAQLRQKQRTLITNSAVSKGSDVRQAVEESQKGKAARAGKNDDADQDDEPDDNEEIENEDSGTSRKKPDTKKRKNLDDDVDESRQVSILDDEDDDDEDGLASSSRKRPSKSRAALSRRQENSLDDDESDGADSRPAKKSRAGGRTTLRRAAAKKRTNYTDDNSDADDLDDDGDTFENQNDDEEEEDVVVVEKPKRKPTSRATSRATSTAASRKKKTPAASSPRKKRTGRKTSFMESEDEDGNVGRGGGSSGAFLDEDWGSAATRSQI
ncbi:hypothetical protein ACA910_003207 [Epithemia clementina (nom. ined.)]